MTTLRTLKKLVFGETWLLPAGIAVVLVTARVIVRPAIPAAWPSVGGFLLLAGVVAVLVASVDRGGRRP